jgi:hypothetical protein
MNEIKVASLTLLLQDLTIIQFAGEVELVRSRALKLREVK